MTLKEFLIDKTLTSVDFVETTIVNLVIGEEVFGIQTDTSLFKIGQPVYRTENFIIEDDILMIDNASVNLNTTNLLTA